MQRESILNNLYPRHHNNGNGSSREPSQSPALSSLSPQMSNTSVRSQRSYTQGSPHLSAPSGAQKQKPSDPVGFKITLETPPAIMYGSPQESVGALISGICEVDLTKTGDNGVVNLQEVSMSIVQVIKYKLPPQIAKRISRGSEQRNVLATWDILKHPHILESRNFAYPFSHLLPGTLPPTSKTPLFSVEYFIYASATTHDNQHSEASLPLHIYRSVVFVKDKTSVRIFPPTTLSLSMILPTALFPNSSVNAEMRIEGLVSPTKQGSVNCFKRWQLKRVNWRVDESVKVKWGEQAEDEYEHKHTLGFGSHKSGWKTDYSLQNGLIELFSTDFCPGVLQRANKDLHDPVVGLSVSHQLICELLIAEEVLSQPNSKQGVLSGSARVLRMQFGFPVTDRPGLGISWEDEVPPMYADIPLSPPQYHDVANLPALEEFKSSNLVFSPLLAPTMSPTLRHLDSSMRGLESRPEVVNGRLASPRSTPLTPQNALLASPRVAPLNSPHAGPVNPNVGPVNSPRMRSVDNPPPVSSHR